MSHRADVQIISVIFNRIGGAQHAETLRDACRPLEVPVLGTVPWVNDLTLPERHLGLVQAAETKGLDAFLVSAAEIVGCHVDIAELVRLAAPIPPAPIAPLGQQIVVARDVAAAFVYDHVLAGWRNAGCQILTFSPLAGEGVPVGADAVYLPGGPSGIARQADRRKSRTPQRSARRGGPAPTGLRRMRRLHGAGRGVGRRRRRAPLDGRVAACRDVLRPIGKCTSAIGRLNWLQTQCWAHAASAFAGTEFHFSSAMSEEASDPLFVARDVQGGNEATMGCVRGSVMGSFAHLIDRA